MTKPSGARKTRFKGTRLVTAGAAVGAFGLLLGVVARQPVGTDASSPVPETAAAIGSAPVTSTNLVAPSARVAAPVAPQAAQPAPRARKSRAS